ncbi:TM2 domain-containing protein [Exiguobacterium aestuarii]|uniref:TM2 domain-containing protein n=1 Tax=Exiguobacterium aestuarii TaxID=273527 RepID=A0ABW2PV71_9BACL|nr:MULTISPECIES: TM2 domain-containing protein [Exiguobacterium]MCT4786923.1 TM2 domain-containing protein [Exiguobacterium aestuarii]
MNYSTSQLTTEEMLFVNSEVEKRKPNLLVAYLLWFFLGGFGGHRFYFKKTGSAIGMLALMVISLALTLVLVGFVGLFIVGVWTLVDAFLMPGWQQREVENIERETIAQLEAREQRQAGF